MFYLRVPINYTFDVEVAKELQEKIPTQLRSRVMEYLSKQFLELPLEKRNKIIENLTKQFLDSKKSHESVVAHSQALKKKTAKVPSKGSS